MAGDELGRWSGDVGDEGRGEVTRTLDRPAFYAAGVGRGGAGDWLTLLHPPYTAWHLSYVAIGAALAPHFQLWRLGGTLLAFFLAVGVGAHALDELAGRPLRTGIAAPVLVVVALLAVALPVSAGIWYGGWRMLPFVIAGVVLLVAYNLELGGGVLHNGFTFALAWGAFPVLTGYYAEDFRLGLAAVLAAVAAFALSLGQRTLSLPVRALRRRISTVEGSLVFADGRVLPVTRAALLRPLENALRALSVGLTCLAVALVASRL
jgi:hypothetical protein